jgi:ribonuclease VapC
MNHGKIIVLDSWAIMAYFEDEPAAEKIANMIADAREQGDRLLMSAVNIGEVWYATARKHSDRDADNAIRELRSIGIEFIDVDWPTTQIAAGYKAKGGISYADCFAAALTKIRSSPPARGGVDALRGRGGGSVLLTGDQEFKQLENEIDIIWL